VYDDLKKYCYSEKMITLIEIIMIIDECLELCWFLDNDMNTVWWGECVDDERWHDCCVWTLMMINLLKAFKWVKLSFKIFWKEMIAWWGQTSIGHWSFDPLRNPGVSLVDIFPSFHLLHFIVRRPFEAMKMFYER